MSRNKANLAKEWFGFKPFRFRELVRLLQPIYSHADNLPFIPFNLHESMDTEWNILVSLHYAISLRLERIIREKEFESQHPEGDWLLTTMEARDGEEKLIKNVFKH